MMTEPERALLRSQGGSGVGAAAELSDMSSHSHRSRFVPCNAVATFASPFAVVRALLPVWSSTRFPWSPPSSLRKGRGLGRRGFAVESAAARICREGGARVTTNVMVTWGGTHSRRCPSFGDRPRWVASVWGRSARNRHDPDLHFAL